MGYAGDAAQIVEPLEQYFLHKRTITVLTRENIKESVWTKVLLYGGSLATIFAFLYCCNKWLR